MKQGARRHLQHIEMAIGALFIILACLLAHAQTTYAHGFDTATDITSVLGISSSSSGGPLQVLRDTVIVFEPLPYLQLVTQNLDCNVDYCLALTFDDGPNAATTPRVLDALERAGANATFFVVGNRVAQNTDLLKRINADGNEIGNHSWSHPDFTRLKPAQIRDQIDQTQRIISNIGLPAPRYFRPPYAARNTQIRQVVNMTFILWNVDPQDWRARRADELAKNVIAQAKPGAIIVLHDTKEITTQALPKILDGLKSDYHFVTVSQLLGLSQNTLGEFTSR